MRRRAIASALSALLLTACGPGALAPPSSGLVPLTGPARDCPAASERAPTGELAVAYPDEPSVWLSALGDDVAAQDLEAVWGLPLFDFDAAGQLRPRLVREAVPLGAAGGGWRVRLILCEGQWSDGEPVGAGDVAATILALREVRPTLTDSILAAEVDGPDVLITFDQSSGRWQHALAGLGTMLPAHVLAAQGIDAYREAIPVSGGLYRLDSFEMGLRRVFTAATGSALGSPLAATIDVLVVPRFELALGLLGEGDLDVALGYEALEAGPRISDVDGVTGVAARGSTLLTWKWQEGAVVTDPLERLQVQASFNLGPFAEGLLDGGQGEVTTSFLPGQPGASPEGRARLDDIPELVVAAPSWQESTGLVARAVRDAVERLGGTMRTASDEQVVIVQGSLGDGHIVIRRTGPWPSLVDLARGQEQRPAAITAADRATATSDAAVLLGQEAFHTLGIEVPLVDLSVAHAWSDNVRGVVPSGHPGIGFTSVGGWSTQP